MPVQVRAYSVSTGRFYETEVTAEDVIYFLASPMEDTVLLARWLSQHMTLAIDHLGDAALHLPVRVITPIVSFTHDTWNGEPRSFAVNVYKAGNKLLLVARERQARDSYFSIIRSGQYKRWDIPNLRRVHEDVNAQEALITLLKTRITITSRSPPTKSVYLSIEGVNEGVSRWGKQQLGDSLREEMDLDAADSVLDEQAVEQLRRSSDDSISYRYVGLLVDRDL